MGERGKGKKGKRGKGEGGTRSRFHSTRWGSGLPSAQKPIIAFESIKKKEKKETTINSKSAKNQDFNNSKMLQACSRSFRTPGSIQIFRIVISMQRN